MKQDQRLTISADNSGPVFDAVEEARAADIPVNFDSVRYSASELYAISDNVPNLPAFNAKHDPKLYVSVNPDENAVDIALSALPTDLVQQVNELYGDKVKLSVSEASPVQPANRINDTSPFYGGGGISIGGCTSGFGYVDNNTYARLMISAGHCANNNVKVYVDGGIRQYMGITTHNLEFVTGRPARDVLAITSAAGYLGSVWVGGPK